MSRNTLPAAVRSLLLLALLAAMFAPLPAVRADGGDAGSGDAAAADDAVPPRSVWERLTDPRSTVRVAAVRELLAQGEELVPDLMTHLTHDSPRVRRAAVTVLVQIAPDQAFEPLVARLDDDSPMVADAARRGLLELFEPGRAHRLEELAARMRERDGGVDAGFDRLLYIYRLREILAVFAKWRTDRSPTGIRFLGQYRGMLDQFPDGVDVLLRFVADDSMREYELGPDWPLGEALVAAVRALGDNNVGDARGPLLKLLQRGGLYGNRFYIRRQGVAYGDGDLQALQQVTALTLHRLGTDLYVDDQLQRYEQSLRDYPNPWMAFMMACIYQELGDMQRCRWALRITFRNDQPGWGGANPWLALAHLHLSAMILQQVEAGDTAAPDPEDPYTHEDDESPSLEVAMKHLKLALELGFDDPQWLRVDPRFDSVRDNADFQRHLRNLQRIYPPRTETADE